ncbi:MAG: isochorismatase family cysteine hydrolase [Pseudomonadota bacterium]
MARALGLGPIGPAAVHLCIDMQRLFAPGGPWPAQWAPRILPAVCALTQFRPERTVFTRFLPPPEPRAMPGIWQAFYEKWRHVTREQIDPALLDLVPDLAGFAPPARIMDKSRYSAFTAPDLLPFLTAHKVDTLILSGAETDICVAATLFDAVDLGFRTIVAREAVCSSSDTGHDAVLTMLERRLTVQVEVAGVEDILAKWSRRAVA